MFKTFTDAIQTGRAIADGIAHFAIGSIVTFCGFTLALPMVVSELLPAPIANLIGA